MESISVRIARLHQQVESPFCQGGMAVNSHLSAEGLQDALLALYEECSCERLRREPDVAAFLAKYENSIKELKRLRVRPTDFKFEALIGRGNFGDVSLVKERGTGHFYAMKTLPKHCSQGQREASSYEEERDILALAARPGASEWLTSLQYAFQDSNNLFLVMEYLPGGDLLGLLDRFDGSLPEVDARFYLAEIVMAINSLHQLGYVHRDIKPDNVLLDRCGHVKLADFGSAAKLNSRGKVESPLPVGTPEYIAPEVLQSVSMGKSSYGVECDFWSLGIVAYELVFGTSPFQGAERTNIYSNIIAHEGGESLEFPSCSGISKDLKELISGLLEPAASRLSYTKIKKHPFFFSISWSTLRDSVPPFLPHIDNESDVSHFQEPSSTSRLGVDTDGFRSRQEGFSGRQLPFVGFTLTPGACQEAPAVTLGVSAKGDSAVEIIKETAHATSSNKANHPDVVRNRELKALKEMLKEREERVNQAIEERKQAETKLDQMTTKALSYRQLIEQERQERKEVETKAVEVVKGLKAKWHSSSQQRISELTSQLQACQSSLGNEKARTDELENRLRTREEQLSVERDNSDRLQKLLQQHKTNMSKARRETLTSIGDAQVVADLRRKLGVEEADNKSLQDKTKLLTRQVEELEREVSRLNERLASEQSSADKSETMLLATTDRLKRVESKLQREQELHQDTKNKLKMVETEVASLTTSALSAVSMEESQASLSALQEQLAESEEQRERLRNKLADAELRDEEQQSKVTCLEEMLGRLENRILSLEEENTKLQKADTLPRASLMAASKAGEVTVLQAQLERLEGQLEKAREASVLDRQAARTAQSDVYKKEKELSDVRIDLRIARRELKTAETEVVTLRGEKETLAASLAETQSKLTESTAGLEAAKTELLKLKEALDKAQKEVQHLHSEEEKVRSAMAEQSRKLSAAEARSSEKVDLISKLQSSLDSQRQECEAARVQARAAAAELAQIRGQIDSLQLNNTALREACTELDNQLVDSDRLRATYEGHIKQYVQELDKVQSQLEKAQGDLRAKCVETEELRSLRDAAEERLKEAHQHASFQATEAQEEQEEHRQLLREARHQSQMLLAQVNELEATLCESDREARENRHVAEALQAKCSALQEEIAVTLTNLQSARDAAEALSSRLEASQIAHREAARQAEETAKKVEEERNAAKNNVIRLQTTIEQQNKVIEFLQAKEQQKRKKTLAGMLFGSARPKENLAPSPLRPAGQFGTPIPKEKARTLDSAGRPTDKTPNRKDLSAKTPVKPQATNKARTLETPKKPPQTPSKPAQTPKAPEVKPPAPVALPASAPVVQDRRVLPAYCRLTINCALTLSDQVVVLGTEEGLYSLHPRASGFQLVHITGVTKVKQIVTAPHLGIVLIIAGSPSELSQCELRALTVAAEAAQCSKPSIALKPVEESPDRCHLCALSGPLAVREHQGRSSGGPATFLCVANPTHVAILRWNLGSCLFEPVRLLTTSVPTASLLFTPHSLLLVCDEVFEVDLQDFSVEDFLDMSDLSLAGARTALKSRASQGGKNKVALLDVTRSGAKAEPEFMLCLPEMALFLDAFGHRSRPGDLKWAHTPQSFMYCSPILFVQHKSGVLSVKPRDTKLCSSDDSFATTSSTGSDAEQGTLPLTAAKLLGTGSRGGTVVLSAEQADGTTALLTISGAAFDDVSILEGEGAASEFSFTSSLENSLDEEADPAKKVQFVQ